MWRTCEQTWRALGPYMTSMAVDVRRGDRTEIDALNLEVARLGETLGVPAPANRGVGLPVKALERSEAPPVVVST